MQRVIGVLMGKVYAVARGRNVGIFRSWAECKAQVDGFPNARYKGFATYAEAGRFLDENSTTKNARASQACAKSTTVGTKRKVSLETEESSENTPSTSKITKRSVASVEESVTIPIVYTDGACSSNGQKGAKAGYGVFWGDDHPDNTAAPLDGPPTNNRAEYTAVICALRQAKARGHAAILVRTDSKLLVSSMTMWLPAWRRNGWRKRDGSEVLNRDLIVELDALMKEVRVEFEHVSAHVGIYGNEKADELAREGASKSKRSA